MGNKKKSLVILAITITAAIIIVWLLFFNEKAPTAPSQEEIIQKQIEELNALRQAAGYKEPTPEEIQKQIEELNKLH